MRECPCGESSQSMKKQTSKVPPSQTEFQNEEWQQKHFEWLLVASLGLCTACHVGLADGVLDVELIPMVVAG